MRQLVAAGRWLGLAILLMPAAACAPQASRSGLQRPIAPIAMAAPAGQAVPQGPGPTMPLLPPEGPPRNRVGLLLPLSGSNRPLGEAMLNASQLALFDLGDSSIEFLPRDTRSTPSGAAEAARLALDQGARALAGPLTLGETSAAATAARAAGTPVLAFTNDANQAGGGVWVMGVTIGEQTERISGAAIAAGARRFGLLAPDDEVGRRLAAALRAQLAAAALPPPVVVLHARLGDILVSARDLATNAGPEGLDAVVLAAVGDRAKQAGATLVGALPNRPRLLGLSIWANDASLAREPALVGAWFAGPDPTARTDFEARYRTAFGDKPPRIAGVAYDAAALAARTSREGAATPPLGEPLMGADGPIMLTPTGLSRRGLAIFELLPDGEPKLVEPAPIPAAAGT